MTSRFGHYDIPENNKIFYCNEWREHLISNGNLLAFTAAKFLFTV